MQLRKEKSLTHLCCLVKLVLAQLLFRKVLAENPFVIAFGIENRGT